MDENIDDVMSEDEEIDREKLNEQIDKEIAEDDLAEGIHIHI